MLVNLAIACSAIALFTRLGNDSIRFHLYFVTLYAIFNAISLLLLPFAIVFPKSSRLTRICFRLLSTIGSAALGITWKLRSVGDLTDLTQPGVMVANHQSVIDLLGLHWLYDHLALAGHSWNASVMSTREVLCCPYGMFNWLTGYLFAFNRHDSQSRLRVQREAAKRLEDKQTLIIYPEGRRNNSEGRLIPFKKGAFRLAIEKQVPVIPVVYSPFVFLDRLNKTMKLGEIVLSVLKPIPTTGLELKDVGELTSRVYNIMNDEFDKLRKEGPFLNDCRTKS